MLWKWKSEAVVWLLMPTTRSSRVGVGVLREKALRRRSGGKLRYNACESLLV